jgi:histidine triad (HIT) family protein
MASCVFCKIISGEFDSSKVYEDDDILAFMDIQPVRPGQVLVVPKEHVDHFSDIADPLASKVFLKAHELSKLIRNKLKPERVGLIVHGYGVPHAHMIVVPAEREDDITSARMARIEDGNVVFSMKNLAVAPRPELDRIAELLRTSSPT